MNIPVEERSSMSEKRVTLRGMRPSFGPNEDTRPQQIRKRIFLLSPANVSGVRGLLLRKKEDTFELARRLSNGEAQLGEIFSFMSALYFRGKLAYARTFANPPAGFPGVLIITPSHGLLRHDAVVNRSDIETMASVPIVHTNSAYREPLQRDASALRKKLGSETAIVFLGSIATPKYLDPLQRIFGGQLLMPQKFLSLGNMCRGGLLLRCSRMGAELDYIPANTVRTLEDESRSKRKRAKISR
jgi:hypothetical protein